MRETPSPTFVNYGARTSIGAFGPLMNEQLDPDVGWSDVERLRGQWRGPLLIKGLLHPGEAREAINRGADGIIVSNHGGRQLDGAVASIRALPGVVEAVGGRAPVLVDGGFRRGIDVVKALALGARAVMIGRPHLWGVACAGRGWRLLGARTLPARDRPRARARRLGRSGEARSEHLFPRRPGRPASSRVPSASSR